jgi:hypothetical protein
MTPSRRNKQPTNARELALSGGLSIRVFAIGNLGDDKHLIRLVHTVDYTIVPDTEPVIVSALELSNINVWGGNSKEVQLSYDASPDPLTKMLQLSFSRRGKYPLPVGS